MKKLLVTGGAGFIGSNYVNHVLREREDYFIVNLDKLTYAGNLENLRESEKNERYRFVKGDVCNAELVDYLFQTYEFDYVVHFAAESHVDRSILGAQVFFQSNVIGTNVLLEAARRRGVERFLQVGTDEVYGSLGETGVFTEETPITPNSPYSTSKAAADMAALAYHRTYDLPVVVTRCSNNYGPLQFPEKLIPLMIINALNDKELPVYGDGMNVRDWIYVIDHNEAVDLVLEKGRVGEVYNVGASTEKPNIEIVKLILEKLGKPESLIKYVKDRPGHDRRYAIDSSKLQSELGWKPKHSFEEAMERTVKWYVENKTWWERIVSGDYRNYYEEQYGSR
ncbi:MAG: dTDP-glucose 4,6-dehydratase [Ignavibacteriales bacterium]|nr:dTDP-glucose 4,6-dehydratase [Ignavibacteriales bacterium]